MSVPSFIRRARSSLARIGAGAGIMALLLAMFLAAPASAATSATAPPTKPSGAAPVQYCAMLVGRAPSPTADSPVLSEACSTQSPAAAKAQLRSAQGQLAPASSDLLGTWFADSNFNGNRTNIYGGAGPCDSAGYRIVPNGYWQTNMSSIAGFGTCNAARLTTRSLTYATTFFPLPSSFIGFVLNDNVGRVQYYRG